MRLSHAYHVFAHFAGSTAIIAAATACGGTTPEAGHAAASCRVVDEPVADDGSLRLVVPALLPPPGVRGVTEEASTRDARTHLEAVARLVAHDVPSDPDEFAAAMVNSLMPAMRAAGNRCMAVRDLAVDGASPSAESTVVLHAFAGVCTERVARAMFGIPFARTGAFPDDELRALIRAALVDSQQHAFARALEAYRACVDGAASLGEPAAELRGYCHLRAASLPRRPDEWAAAAMGRSGEMVLEDLTRQLAASTTCGVPRHPVSLGFVIDAGGTAEAVAPTQGNLDPAFASCIISGIHHVTFRPAPDSPPQRVELHLPTGWTATVGR